MSRREEIMWWAWFVTDLCLQCGSEVHTAYNVGATFAKGLCLEESQ